MLNAGKTQNVSIPKPVFKVNANSNPNTNGNSNGGAGPSVTSGPPPITIGGNHPMKLSTEIKMEVEDDYSNDSRGVKRKREDEDDFEYEEEFEPVA